MNRQAECWRAGSDTDNQVTTVYNLRVADYPIYIVGCEEWDFSAWAHNVNTCTIRALSAQEQATLRALGINDTHEVTFRRVDGTIGKRTFPSQADAETFALQQRNKLAAADGPLLQATPVKPGVPDRVQPNSTIPEEVQAWNAAQGLDAGKPANGHQKIPIQGLGDPIYASGNYEKWKYVTEIPLSGGGKRRVEIHYVKNADTGAVGHFKITNSQVIP